MEVVRAQAPNAAASVTEVSRICAPARPRPAPIMSETASSPYASSSRDRRARSSRRLAAASAASSTASTMTKASSTPRPSVMNTAAAMSAWNDPPHPIHHPKAVTSASTTDSKAAGPSHALLVPRRPNATDAKSTKKTRLAPTNLTSCSRAADTAPRYDVRECTTIFKSPTRPDSAASKARDRSAEQSPCSLICTWNALPEMTAPSSSFASPTTAASGAIQGATVPSGATVVGA
mmetsp:Transcript_21889/g.68562  ORF Transcript_21889/g.68562 Transcript_21889/m.68562 type:complete len:234 (-) Transcript_21889:2337-3038(-)